MLYCKIGIVAETFESMRDQLEDAVIALHTLHADGEKETIDYNKEEGFKVMLESDQAWDYTTPLSKHMELLL